MALNAGDAYLSIHPTLASGFGRQLARQVQNPVAKAGQEASGHFGREFSRGLRTASVAIGVGLAAATAVAVRGVLATTKAASDLNETINKTDVIFGRSAKGIQQWARSSARSFGLSRNEALTNAAAFGDMFRQLGIGLPTTVKMSKSMVALASDLASFSNADISQVLEAQQAAFRGEYDSLQRFIPAINAARVQQVALAQTHKKSAKDLTAAEKAQATYTIMLHDSTRAQGDFARTSGGLANQQRIQKAQWENLKTVIGQGFLPAQLAVTKVMTTKLIPAATALAREFGPKLGGLVTRAAKAFADWIPPADQLTARLNVLGPQLRDQIAPSLKRVWESLSKIGPSFQRAGGGGKVFADSLGIAAPILDVVARNIHNLVPWLPAIVAGFLAFRAIRTVTAPLVQIGELISNITAPFRIAALFAQNRALKAHTVALAENTAALGGNAVAQDLSTAATNTGTLAQIRARGATLATAAAQRVAAAGLAATLTSLGVFGAAVGVLAVLAAKMNSELHKAADESERTGRLMTIGGKGGQFFAQRVAELDPAVRAAAAATRDAAAAAVRHAGALNAERLAVDALKDALAGEEASELDVRQAKINVASAQTRLTELVKAGRKGSLDYKQAQVDLKRAQIDLRERTAAYREAQLKANAATGGAMRASQAAQPPMRGLGGAAKATATRLADMGVKSGNAAQEVAGLKQSIAALRSKVLSIKATASLTGFGALGGTALVAAAHGRAGGGPIVDGVRSRDSTLVMVRKDEHVWTPEEVDAVGGHGAMYRMRADALAGSFRGYAAGGQITGSDSFTGIASTARGVRRIQPIAEGIVARASIAIVKKALASLTAMGGGPLPSGGGAGAALARKVAIWTANTFHRAGEAAAWFRRLMMESGGNPSVVNKWDCLTLDAMILTRRGWLKHDEVRIGDETIGYNPATGQSEWTPVTQVIHYDDAPLVRIGNSRWQATTTPNHRWAEIPRSGSQDRPMRFVTTEAIGSRSRLLLAAPAATDARLDVTVAEAALLGWIAGDGHVERACPTPEVCAARGYTPTGICAEHRARQHPTISIAQSKPDMVTKLRALLATIPHAAYVDDRLTRTGKQAVGPRHQFRLDYRYAADLLRRVGHPQRDVVAQVTAMSTEQRAAWLEAVIDAEGHRAMRPGYSAPQVTIYQRPGTVLDAITLAVYLSGARPRVGYARRSGHPTWSPEALVRINTPVVLGQFLTKQDAGHAPVWCVTTELGTWTARQDDHVFLTGNSNWARGTPSVGIAQVIGPTFRGNAGPYRRTGPFLYGVSINPYANSYAGGHYAIGRYGSLAAVDPRVKRGGYDSGGWLPPHSTTLAVNRTSQWEPVGPPGAGRTINVTVPLTIYGDVTAAQRAQMRQIAEDMGERVAAELSDALARRGSGV